MLWKIRTYLALPKGFTIHKSCDGGLVLKYKNGEQKGIRYFQDYRQIYNHLTLLKWMEII